MLHVLLCWLRAPVPARKVSVWREMVPVALGIFGAIAVEPSDTSRARIAMAGLGLFTALISISRPAALWDTGRLRDWRDAFGDRAMWALYIVVGATIIGFAIMAPVHS